MRLVTWNINSVRIRLSIIEQLIEAINPDVICLQEIKAQEAEFPRAWFEARGYVHQAIHGQRAYHGVAIVSRLPIEDMTRIDWCSKGDARHVAAKLPGDVWLHNFYVPAGGDEPDVEVNDKFAHKLAFLDEMTDWAAKLEGTHIVVGDLNVAPLEHDVWSHKDLLNVVSHTPPETTRMQALMAAHPFVDAMRHFVPDTDKLYTWWSYRASDWRASNRGRRLDHVWVSGDLAPHLEKMLVIDEARGWERPSDHAPVLVEFTRSRFNP